MEIGTPHFRNVKRATEYYKAYGLSRHEVHRKLREGEIHIGEPEQYGPDWVITLNESEGRYYQRKRSISRAAWEKHFGPICPDYCNECQTCIGWDLWSEITRERIEYKDHDYHCTCRECPSKADRVEAKRIEHGIE
jgi:hypothetical protein